MKRVLIPATAAVLVLTVVAIAAWIAVAGFVRAEIPVQARLASALLDANATMDEAVVQTLRAPGVHIFAFDPRTGVVIDAGSGGTQTHAMSRGPIDGGTGRRLPGPPPDRLPRALGPEQPGSLPPGPDQPGGLPPFIQHAQPGPFASVVIALSNVRPQHVEGSGGMILIAPDARELSLWFAIDLIGYLAGAIGIGTFASSRVSAHARAERSALEAQARERGEAAERYKRFLAETGHELRTPLTVMSGYVDILRARPPVESLDARILEGMHEEASRMRVLVEKMMTLARLESTAAVPRLLDLATATREAALTLQRRYPEREIVVQAEQTASIVIDADDFGAALGNILENAIKYAPDSPITIATSVGGEGATAAVSDRGPGIRAEEQSAIFERFQRGHGRAFGEGLGLGLAIVKRVADRWNGTVVCTSTPGNTVFRLTFPLADEERHGFAR
jgi:signal transduction histidine kinase